jgi:[ribosomal protein S5]-alanine N-acetyltransferase
MAIPNNSLTKRVVKLSSRRLMIRTLLKDDVGDVYLKWMLDEDVIRFTEARFGIHSLDKIRAYVNRIFYADRELLFGIFIRGTDKHIGNIKLGLLTLGIEERRSV